MVEENQWKKNFVTTQLTSMQRQRWERIKTSFLRVLERYLIADLVEKDGFWGAYLLMDHYFAFNLSKNFQALWRKKTIAMQDLEIDVAHKKLLTYFLYEFKLYENKNKH